MDKIYRFDLRDNPWNPAELARTLDEWLGRTTCQAIIDEFKKMDNVYKSTSGAIVRKLKYDFQVDK